MTGLSKAEELVTNIAPEIWRIMIKQQYAEATAMFIGVILAGIYMIIFFKSWPKIEKKIEDGNRYDEDGWRILQVFMVLALLAAIIVSIIGLTKGTMVLINPEYYAIKAIGSVFTGV